MPQPKNEYVPDPVSSELRDPKWSVVSFERLEASDLTYSDAVRRMNELENAGTAGLCILTNEAAKNLGPATSKR